MKITLKEIAKRAGVSPSTVSRVINNSKPVNEEVKKRVINVLKETNYLPFVAQNLSLQQDQLLIGVICPQYSNTVLDDLIVGINRVCKLYGYDTVIGLTDGSTNNELHYIDLFSNKLSVQGLIFMGEQWQEEHLELIQKNLTPVVLIGQISSIPSIPSVHVDNITASYEAVTYLLQNGHRKIAMIRGNTGQTVREDRFHGYRKALIDSGIPLEERWIVDSELSIEGGSQAIASLLEHEPIPSAVFCSTDSIAIGAVTYLMDHGYRVPEDISVFGFDGIELSSLMRPRLSTIEYSAVEIGMTATRNLIKLCKNEQEQISPHINITHNLVIRESTNSLKSS
ncbi:LacI family DNA-binding transcriptional regulator [Bacillus sp. 31A1R]|uniref:LacI family DNA-binding transcriptional regulator n=1 Tax=Robertmurraya mangrovi TaxID=3098077 RepID=A0ABU5IX43_9BACI|nr:LacI family DNA-binding transcriptional regulator [Bacillus sp. 31A1R]MDZ5471691.1 LacI family DNA-binding transcriptional regulator [Bacillus sp. 31A1R]